MTALPATRADSLAFIAQLTEDGTRSVDASIAVWDTLLALARKGAETVGATEAWLDTTERRGSIMGRVYKRVGSTAVGVRRCLILPENE